MPDLPPKIQEALAQVSENMITDVGMREAIALALEAAAEECVCDEPARLVGSQPACAGCQSKAAIRALAARVRDHE